MQMKEMGFLLYCLENQKVQKTGLFPRAHTFSFSGEKIFNVFLEMFITLFVQGARYRFANTVIFTLNMNEISGISGNSQQ